MLLRRFYDDRLAQASYMVGCQATGETLVVDPNRDAEMYVAAAAEEGVRITHVTETHIHADYLSGSRELAVRTGATLLLSDEGGEGWRYGFAPEARAVLLKDGDLFSIGNIRIQAIHTPGHTPEHMSFLVTDGAASDEPMGMLSGDFIFVGDVGRPDLLEKAAGVAGTMEDGARQLYRSLLKIADLPDHLQIWPGHGAGSACGKALGAVPTSTLGYERLVSWAFQHDDEDSFVASVLEDQPEPPRYFATMKAMNRDGPPVLGGIPDPGRLGPGGLAEVLRGGGTVIDLRPRSAYSAGHVKGTLHLPLDRSFTNWAGWLLPYDEPIHLLAESHARAAEATRALALIGIDRVAGWFGPDALDAADELEGAETLTPTEAFELHRNGSTLVDVRASSEWKEGHAPDARHIHLGTLPDRISELEDAGPILFVCRSGNRSAIAQGIALAHGLEARNVEGGMTAWSKEGLPVER